MFWLSCLQDGWMFGDPDRSPAVFPQQRRAEGGVWRRRRSCLLSDHRAERRAGGQSHTCVSLHANCLHTCFHKAVSVRQKKPVQTHKWTHLFAKIKKPLIDMNNTGHVSTFNLCLGMLRQWIHSWTIKTIRE